MFFVRTCPGWVSLKYKQSNTCPSSLILAERPSLQKRLPNPSQPRGFGITPSPAHHQLEAPFGAAPDPSWILLMGPRSSLQSQGHLLEGRSQSLRPRLALALGDCHPKEMVHLLPASGLLRAEAGTTRGSRRDHQHQRLWLGMMSLCPWVPRKVF